MRSSNKPMQRHAMIGIGLFFCLALAGCSSSDNASALVPVRGTVLCDGAAAEGVVLTLHPSSDRGAVSTAISGADGGFVVSTYEQGDGAEPGTYVVTCVWGTYDPLSRGYTGDRLQGKYASPRDSSIRWTLSPDLPPPVMTVELVSRP